MKVATARFLLDAMAKGWWEKVTSVLGICRGFIGLRACKFQMDTEIQILDISHLLL